MSHYKAVSHVSQFTLLCEGRRDRLESEIETNLNKAEALRQSILKQAFEGKLVPQDLNDEPASILLERIRAEREAQKNGKVRNSSAK